jgi:hypothetical protein
MAAADHWMAEPEQADYVAAATFLALVLPEDRAKTVARSLADAPQRKHRANDLLRASGLPLLPASDPEVVKDLKKLRKGRKLSPVLLVRGHLGQRALTIADGYHRICASYHIDEDQLVPAHMVDLPT